VIYHIESKTKEDIMSIVSVLLIVLAVVIYINIGYALGHWTWRVFKKTTGVPKWIDFVLWPISSVGENPQEWRTKADLLIKETKTAKGFGFLMSVIWPIKVAWNLMVISIMGTCFLLYHLFRLTIRLITYPIRRITGFNGH